MCFYKNIRIFIGLVLVENSLIINSNNNLNEAESSNLFTCPFQLLNYFCKQSVVDYMIKNNPNIKKILLKNGLDYSVYSKNIKDIINTHLKFTTKTALKIASKMQMPYFDRKQLEIACVFHDFGKILIPYEIINKDCELNSSEKQIINLHARLGFELLITTKMDLRILNLIKNHHVNSEINHDVLGKILSVADIYSALREERAYKNPLNAARAVEILDQKAKKGEVSAEVVYVLNQIVNTSSIAA